MRKQEEIHISIASPDEILKWSRGEVTSPEILVHGRPFQHNLSSEDLEDLLCAAIFGDDPKEIHGPKEIHYSFNIARNGLLCERIFGPVKDWECPCGKYRGIRYKGMVCGRCGVEIAKNDVRRYRMGHISLAVPVVHIWYLDEFGLSSKISEILNIGVHTLKAIVYYESYAVIQPGSSRFSRGDVISSADYLQIQKGIGNQEELPEKERFIAKTGGDAVRHLLASVDIREVCARLKAQIKGATSWRASDRAMQTLKFIQIFVDDGSGHVSMPEWMVMTVIPVIPPYYRPVELKLVGSKGEPRHFTSDLNLLYQRIIIRKNRLMRLMEIRAPEVILREERIGLQEAADSLFYNLGKCKVVGGPRNRRLRSLTDLLHNRLAESGLKRLGANGLADLIGEINAEHYADRKSKVMDAGMARAQPNEADHVVFDDSSLPIYELRGLGLSVKSEE